MLKTHKFARKPFYVDAVRVSDNNMEEVADWCQGTIETLENDARYISVEVHRPMNERQTQAFVGDWVLFAGNGYKVYTPKAFDKSFEKVKTLTKAQADEAGIKVPHESRTVEAAQKVTNEQRPVVKVTKRPRPTPPVNPVLSKEIAGKIEADAGRTETSVPITHQKLISSLKKTAEDDSAKAFHDSLERVANADHRDAKTGKYVTKEYAEANPDTTVAEKDEADKLIEEVLRTELPGDQS